MQKSPLKDPLLKHAATTFAEEHTTIHIPDEEGYTSPSTSSASAAASSAFTSPPLSNGMHTRRHYRAKSMPGVDLAREAAATLTDKVKDRLHNAQVAMLHKTEDRHALYSEHAPATADGHGAPRRVPLAGAAMPKVQAQPKAAPARPVKPARPRANSETDALTVASKSKWRKSQRLRKGSFMAGLQARFLSEDGIQARPLRRLGSMLEKSTAYMGIDWYQMQERQKRLSWLFFIENLYFWCYAGYIVTAILVGAVLIWALEPHGGLTFAESVYSAAACVSQSGLAVTDWSKQAQSTYIISFLLIISGSASLMHMAPVFLRRLSFRMQARMTERMEERLSLPTTTIETPTSGATPHGFARFERTYSDPGIFSEKPAGFEAIAEEPKERKRPPALDDIGERPRPLGVIGKTATIACGEGAKMESEGSFRRWCTATWNAGSPDVEQGRRGSNDADIRGTASMPVQKQGEQKGVRGSEQGRNGAAKKHHTSNKLSEMHRLEYKALGKVLKIMFVYWITVHVAGWLIFYTYFEFGSGPTQDKFHGEGLNSKWHAAYLTVSSFQNNGLVMTPSSVMDFRWSPLLLNTIGALILLGNTCLPIAVRAIAWWWSRRTEPDSEERHVLDFLLEHPRRCFTHMFPAVHTLWLLLVVVTLILSQTAVMLWQDSDGKAFKWDDDQGIEQQLSMMDRFWNSLFQAISTRTAGINSVNIADLSQGTTFLMVVMMYFSTTPTVVTMRFSATELDITGRAEGVDEEVLLGDNSLKTQARRYLTQDLTYLILTLFFICVFEKHQFAISAKEITPDSDGIYGDFSFFKVLFEMVSAYGTCGFSLGYRNQTMSFSGMWSAPSQYLLVVVMVLGRLRGLPDSIDPSVKIAMRHGENTEHTFIHT